MGKSSQPDLDPGGDPVRINGFRIAALGLSSFAMLLGFLAPTPFLPAMAQELGVSVSAIGQTAGLTMLLATLIGLVSGPISDRVGVRLPMVLGLGSLAISALGTALAPSFGALLAARSVGSFGRATVLPGAVAHAGEASSTDTRRHAISGAVLGLAVAPAIGIPLLTVIAAALGWRAAFVALAGLSALAGLLIWLSLKHEPVQVPASNRGTLLEYRRLMAYQPVLGVVLEAFVGNVGLWMCLTYFAAFLIQTRGLDVQAAGIALGSVGFGLVIGSVLGAGRRVGVPSRALLGWTRIGSGTLFCLAFTLPVEATVAAILVVGSGVLTGVGSVVRGLVVTSDTTFGRAITLTCIWSALSLGSAGGASLGGVLLETTGYGTLGIVALALSSLAALSAAWSQSKGSSSHVPIEHTRAEDSPLPT